MKQLHFSFHPQTHEHLAALNPGIFYTVKQPACSQYPKQWDGVTEICVFLCKWKPIKFRLPDNIK